MFSENLASDLLFLAVQTYIDMGPELCLRTSFNKQSPEVTNQNTSLAMQWVFNHETEW